MGEANLDPEALVRLAKQMVQVVMDKTVSEASFLDELNADLFGTSLACQEDHVELLTLIEDLEKQITTAENNLQVARLALQSGVAVDELRKDREALLHREISLKQEERALQSKLEELGQQREALQDKKERLKKLDAEIKDNHMVLALCASTFQMIPSDEGANRVAGNLVDKKGCVVDTFGFDTHGMDAFEVCEKLWDICMANDVGSSAASSS